MYRAKAKFNNNYGKVKVGKEVKGSLLQLGLRYFIVPIPPPNHFDKLFCILF